MTVTPLPTDWRETVRRSPGDGSGVGTRGSVAATCHSDIAHLPHVGWLGSSLNIPWPCGGFQPEREYSYT